MFWRMDTRFSAYERPLHVFAKIQGVTSFVVQAPLPGSFAAKCPHVIIEIDGRTQTDR